jgi:hypothetical protein
MPSDLLSFVAQRLNRSAESLAVRAPVNQKESQPKLGLS